MRRKIIMFLGVLTISFQLVGCNKLSDNELKKAANTYESALQELCEKYELDDAIIDVGNSFETREDNIYVDTAYVTSDKFSDLTGEQAFAFAKEFSGLDGQCLDYDDATVSYVTNISSNGNHFEYDREKNIEYLMYEYNNAVVTYKDDELMYNIFDNKEYENTDFDNQTDNNGAEYSDTNNNDIGTYEEVTDSDTKINVWVCAQDIVSNSLKSPSSANFCNITEVTVYSNGESDYTIIGYVDADNDFGANIRNDFIVTLTYTGTGYTNGTVTFN